MSLPADPKAELQKAILNRSAVIVAGTGVSIAASNNHPQASWTGLLKSGLELLLKHNLISAEDSAAHLHLLSRAPETVQFIATAQTITREMSPRMFQEWLKDTIGDIKASNREVLGALENIRQCGNMLATTNYDGLLLKGHKDLSAITWKDKAAFLSAYRSKETNHVFFLHGYWEAPESVILDERSYNEITRDQSYRDELSAIWRTSTWMYVGCGENGLSDPDIGLLLDLYGKRARDDGHWDFCLVRKADKDRLQRYFHEKELNICAVAFGENYGDLPSYLRSLLPAPITPISTAVTPAAAPITSIIPCPPSFYAAPDYIGSHKFVGRSAELQVLSDWAAPADPTNLVLFEAIGGNGKSMLTWEWTQNHALAARPANAPWAGRFWYSFYERGAIMADFCQRALAYMTEKPLECYAKMKAIELKDELLAQLHARPWLLILDGLERVLVAYHRIDAAEIPDEQANAPTDKIVKRNPCDAIRDEDNDLLRALAAAAPSKILVSSRLTPRVLLNPSGQPITGAKRITLPGLRPPDAEALLRSCGIEGNSAAMQSYLATNCDNHPLVIGILGGLISNYLPARGSFDAWSIATDGGAALDLASLDLIQRRNHILHAAINALSCTSKQLLSTLALVTDAVDYETLKAFNPHLPPEPIIGSRRSMPVGPDDDWHWQFQCNETKEKELKSYEKALEQRKAKHEKAIRNWLASAEFREAQQKLSATVNDLEERGLLQWDRSERKYDLHPVVRGVASGGMTVMERERHGLRVVDYFSTQPRRPYQEVKIMEDVRNGIHIVRILLKLERFQQAADLYLNGMAYSILFSLGDHVETLKLLRGFFPEGWHRLPERMRITDSAAIANCAGLALRNGGNFTEALGAFEAAIQADLQSNHWLAVRLRIGNITHILLLMGRLAKASRLADLGVTLSTAIDDKLSIFMSQLALFSIQIALGKWDEAELTWLQLETMGRDWPWVYYGAGMAEKYFALLRFEQRKLEDRDISVAINTAKEGNNPLAVRRLHSLLGDWRLEQGEWALAAASYQTAVGIARERSLCDADSETGLALAKFHLGQLPSPRDEAERLAHLHNPAHRYLAMLWLAVGDTEQAKQYALAAYKWAWADGEPYVHRYELTKTTELLQQMNVSIPKLTSHNPAKDEKLLWENDAYVAIKKLQEKTIK